MTQAQQKQTHDVVIASSKAEAAGTVVVTTTDAEAAGRIAAAINAESLHLYQCKGLRAFPRKSNRDVAAQQEGEAEQAGEAAAVAKPAK